MFIGTYPTDPICTVTDRRQVDHDEAPNGGSSLAAYGHQMTERDLNPVWPATAIAESALPRNIKGRKINGTPIVPACSREGRQEPGASAGSRTSRSRTV